MTAEKIPEISFLEEQGALSSLPHFSSLSFRDSLKEGLNKLGFSYSHFLKGWRKPVVKVIVDPSCQGGMTPVRVLTLFQKRAESLRFILELIASGLVFSKRIEPHATFSLPFYFKEEKEIHPLIFSEMVFLIPREEILRKGEFFQLLEKQLKIGLSSRYDAKRILEFKGLSIDIQTSLIQENVSLFVKKFVREEEEEAFFLSMQYFLVTTDVKFRLSRKVRHLSRLIILIAAFRKEVQEDVKEDPDERHVRFKVFNYPQEREKLSLVITLNVIKNKELVEEKHLMKAMRLYVSELKAVPQSFFSIRVGNEPILTLYLELEKENRKEFTAEEIALIKQKLPSDLEEGIEYLLPPVFNPRNEEEIMRNILSLSAQIKYLKDMPQAFITFDEQTKGHLFFTVILVRVLKEFSFSVQESFKLKHSFLDFIPDRTKTIGYLRKKYPKEATVFRVKMKKEFFLRLDHSIDLYKARQTVIGELHRIFGEVRDYNGGMISKQHEVLALLRRSLSSLPRYNEFLLENFFYSLNPVIMRTVLEAETLQILFIMLLDAIQESFFNEESYLKIKKENPFVFAMVSLESRELEHRLEEAFLSYNKNSIELASCVVKVYDTHYLGYVYRADSFEKQEDFCNLLKRIIEN